MGLILFLSTSTGSDNKHQRSETRQCAIPLSARALKVFERCSVVKIYLRGKVSWISRKQCNDDSLELFTSRMWTKPNQKMVLSQIQLYSTEVRTQSGTSVGRKGNPSHETRFGPSIHAFQTRSLAGIVRKRNLGPAKTRVFTPHRTNNVRPSDPEMQENVLSTEASLAFPMPCGQAPLTIYERWPAQISYCNRPYSVVAGQVDRIVFSSVYTDKATTTEGQRKEGFALIDVSNSILSTIGKRQRH